MGRLVLISGCSGGGKSTLLEALAALGHEVVPEPGRRVIAAFHAGQGGALPWDDLGAFARHALALARSDHAAALARPGLVFFDRGTIDAAAALEQAEGVPLRDSLGPERHYHRRVFLTPPWPEIYVRDAERRHDLAAAEEEYERLRTILPALGYEAIILPRTDVGARVRFVLDTLADGRSAIGRSARGSGRR